MNTRKRNDRERTAEVDMNVAGGLQAEAVVAALRQCASRADARQILASFPQDGSRQSVTGGMRLELGVLAELQLEASALKKCAELQIQSAPQLVELIDVGDMHGVLITVIEGLGDKLLEVCAFGLSPSVHLSASARESLLADVERLTSAGYANPAMERYGNWYLNPTTESVVITPWRTLREESSEVCDLLRCELARMVEI